MAKKKKYTRRYYNRYTKTALTNDLTPTYPYCGKFLKVGDAELLLTKTTRKDVDGNPVYLGTVVKRHGMLKQHVSKASHIWVKPV